MNADKIRKLQKVIIDKLVPLIKKDYVLLDIPNHANIGDNLIWEGEIEFLNRYIDHLCAYSANWYTVDKSKIADNVILFHGGGNFGDLYYECQIHRMDIIKEFPNNKIIVFPQSVHYNDKVKFEEDMKVFNSHRDIIICARDQVSYDMLCQYVDNEKLLLLPDMAFFIDIKSKINDSNQILILERTDTEKIDASKLIENIIAQNSQSKVDISDWPSMSNNKYIAYLQAVKFGLQFKLSILLKDQPVLSKLVDSRYGLNNRKGRERYIKQGVEFIDAYNKVYTTRLHGLILATLLGKDVYIIDNMYAKCLNFYQTWLADFESIRLYENNS